MFRELISDLMIWKKRENRKPLIIRGARQVGKTWLMQHFGSKMFTNTIYINFQHDKVMKDYFSREYNLDSILSTIQLHTGTTLDENTLIIFDEIQESPDALMLLKYFYEEKPELFIISAGSLLGVADHQGYSFPVGKVDFLDLYPLNFHEFLLAVGQEKLLKILTKENTDYNLINAFKEDFIKFLKLYLCIGGMPEVVASYAKNKDLDEVKRIQNSIILSYENDFSKHAPNSEIKKISKIWNSIPLQLAKENKKFKYSDITKGSRAKDFEIALQWLIDGGYVYKIERINKHAIPLKAYLDQGAFKMFLLDIGLLSNLSELEHKSVIEGNRIFQEFKGTLTEQFVLQQLIQKNSFSIYYWSAQSSDGEIDFILQYQNEIFPLEVKASENLQAKSLRAYHQKNNPIFSIRSSLSNYRREEWLVNVPIYMISLLESIIDIELLKRN